MTISKSARAVVLAAFTLVSGAGICADGQASEPPKQEAAPTKVEQKQECKLSARSVFGAMVASVLDLGEVKLKRRNIDGFGTSAADNVQRQISPECAPKAKESPVVLPHGYVR